MNSSPRPFFARYLVLLISSFGFVFCLTCLFLGMRAVMYRGGFVAVGGPYEIAHPAPGWIGVVPASILAGLIFVFINAAVAGGTGGLRLALLAWPALFLSLGWNFFEFGIFRFHRPVWGWLVCGVLFAVMGGAPLVVKPFYSGLFKKPKGSAPALLLAGQIVALVLAAVAAVAFLRRLGG